MLGGQLRRGSPDDVLRQAEKGGWRRIPCGSAGNGGRSAGDDEHEQIVPLYNTRGFSHRVNVAWGYGNAGQTIILKCDGKSRDTARGAAQDAEAERPTPIVRPVLCRGAGAALGVCGAEAGGCPVD